MSIQSINPHLTSLYTALLFCRELLRDTDIDIDTSMTELHDILEQRYQEPGCDDIYIVLFEHVDQIAPFYDCGFLDGSLMDGIIELNRCFRR